MHLGFGRGFHRGISFRRVQSGGSSGDGGGGGGGGGLRSAIYNVTAIGALTARGNVRDFGGNMHDIERLARHHGTGGSMGLAMVVGIAVIIQTIVVPVGAALLQGSGTRGTASLAAAAVAVAVENDVFKLEAARVKGGAA